MKGIFVFLSISSLLFCVSSFNITRIHYIDSTPEFNGIRNYLFRGNEPKNDSNQFAYDDLVQYIIKRGQEEANLTIPQHFYLVDINLENEVVEDGDITMEDEFFTANPNLGEFINWPIIGSVWPPDDFPESVREYMAETLESWSFDKLPSTMQQLRNLLYTQNSQPTVIYIHCEAGVDRTGEISGSYYMKYLNWTYGEALSYDDNVEPRPISVFAQNELQWYCYYLKWVEGFNLTCEPN